MHPGKLEGHTAAARVYHALRSDPGRWWGGSEGPGLRAPGRQPSTVIDPACGTGRLILGGGSTTEAAASQPTPTATADGRRVQDRQARPRVVIRGTDAP